MRTRYVAASVLGAILLVGSASGQPFYLESDFPPALWTLVYEAGGAGQSAAAQLPSAGNPGAHLSVTNFSSNDNIIGFVYFAGATYDPSTSGSILSVDGSFDHLTRVGAGQGVSLALRQGGTNFYASSVNLTYPKAWANAAWTGLTAADFRTFASASQHPDFSASGSPIQFGIFNWNAAVGVRTTVSGFDNYQVSIDISLSEVRIWTAVELGFMTKTGRLYQVQYATNLSDPQWQDLGAPISGAGSNIFLFDSSRYDAKRFYRIVNPDL